MFYEKPMNIIGSLFDNDTSLISLNLLGHICISCLVAKFLLVDSLYKGIIFHLDIYMFHQMSIIGFWEGFNFSHVKS